MGPWLCVPALRRVCRFEVELADGTAAMELFRFHERRASFTVSAATLGHAYPSVKIGGQGAQSRKFPLWASLGPCAGSTYAK